MYALIQPTRTPLLRFIGPVARREGRAILTIINSSNLGEIMKKIVLLVSIFGTASMYAAAPVVNNADEFTEELKRQLRSQGHRDWEQIFGADWNKASKEEKIAMMEGAFANNRVRWDLLKVTESIRMLAKPKTLASLSLASLGIFAAWHATSLVKDVAKHYLLIPPLCNPSESSIRGWDSTVKDFFVYEEKKFPVRSDVVLTEHLKERFAKLSHAITNAAKNDVNFRHYLLYGPPGTGKTMMAKAIAQEAGLEHMYFSAANLEQYSLEEGVQQIRHLFEYAKSYPKKLMVIMDEADSIFAHRDTCSDKVRTFLNLILTYTGTEQSNYVVIAITNRPQDFDEAALSRFGVKIKLDAPGFEERKMMFANYAQKYFVDSHTVNRDKRSIFQWLFSRKPAERMPLKIAEDVFTDETFFDRLAKRSEGLAGREIADVISNVQHDAYGTPDHTVTQEMLLNALEDKFQDIATMKDFTKGRGRATAAA